MPTPATTVAAVTATKLQGDTSKVPSVTSFKDELAGATAKTPGAAPAAATAARLQHVKGHHYAKAIGGELDGRYVNRTDNARKGEDFAIVRRDGRTFHVYGEGADRAVVEVKRKEAPAQPGGAAATPAAGTPTGGAAAPTA